jgi:DNA-binding NarL/FixJ family response regulator
MMTTARIRVLCADDHRVVREGIASMIGRQDDMEVVAAAATAEQAVALFREFRPDVTLMDLQFPMMTGLEAIRMIRREHSDARIIVLTMYQGDEDVYRALEAGAITYLLKGELLDDLISTVRDVHAGKRPIAPKIAAQLAEYHAHRALSVRENEVLKLMAAGLRNKEIATTLQITEDTTKAHVKSILNKLNVNDRTAAVTAAVRRGIIRISS